MRRLLKIVGVVLGVVLLALAGLGAWLFFAPPDLIRVATGYSARTVCSNVFVAGRDRGEVMTVDVQSPGHPLLRIISASVDPETGIVQAGIFGFLGRNHAMHRDGLGCATVPDGNFAAVARFAEVPVESAPPPAGLWPQGDSAGAPDPRIAAIIADPEMAGPGMRAIVVVHEGRIVAERYGEGLSAATPLIGWSMTKTVNAALVGTLIARDRLARGQRGLFNAWQGSDHAEISLADLMSMTDGLEFHEDYGAVSDALRMLYLEPDMAAFAASKPLVEPIGQSFSYSSGSSVMLSRIWQNAIGDEEAALAWPRRALFGPLGMRSAILETDARGTFVGSSYLWATPHDWARFGLLLARDGIWDNADILPPGFVTWMREPTEQSGGRYGRGQVWLHGPIVGTPPDRHPDEGFLLPDDTFWASGHDGQAMAIIPSRDLVVLRMGLTAPRLGYKPQRMVEAIVNALD